MGGDYRGDAPEILHGGRKRKRPPTIDSFSKKIRLSILTILY